MEGSGQFFQLDEDDMFSSDSFLEELEQVEKVEQAVFKSKQAVSHHGPQPNGFSNTSKAAPSMPTRNATPVLPQVKTPVSGEGRKFSFKSKTSPEIPLPPDIGSHKQRDSSVNIGERIEVGQNQSKGLVRSNTDQSGSINIKGIVTPESSVKSNKLPQSVTKLPSPLANLRQLNSNRFKPVIGISNQAGDKKNLENDSSAVLDTSLGDFKEPPSKTVSGGHRSGGTLRPAGSMVQNSRPMVPRPEMVQGGHGTCGNLSTPGSSGQSPGSSRKPMMTSPPQGRCPTPQQDTPRTTHKAPHTPLSSRVTSMSHEQSSNSSTMNTPIPGRTFRERQAGSNVQARNQNAAQSPHTGPGCNVSPGYDNQSRGTGAAMHSPQSRTSVSSYGQTPPPRGHDSRYRTPSGNPHTTPGSSVRTPTVHGRGMNTPGMGLPQREHTPAAGHAQGQQTPIAGHAHRQHTPVAGHAKRQQTPVAGHAQRQQTPVMGHAQRPHPSSSRPLSNQRQPVPGQPSRPVLTPRVAHLCKGSGSSPGAGAVHGGTRKFPGPAGLLPKLTPGLKLKDAAVALKKKVEEEKEEQLSQETEESSEEVTNIGDFEHGAWFLMKTELGIKDGDPNSILQQNNLALVIRKASLKQLTKNKVNHLCVMIKTISLNSSDASVSLCDPSGEMQGTIHRRLIEEYQGDLRPGSVLVLRQVGVLSPSQRNHYLNITPSNLIQVFPGESSSRPGSQQTPKRTRKRSGKTPSRKRSSEKGIPEHSKGPSPSIDESSAPGRRGASDERLGSSDALDVVTMDTDTYVEDDDAGIWEEMLDDEDDEDVLLMDSQVAVRENDMRSRLDTRKEEPTGKRDALHSKHFDGVDLDHTKSTSGSSASSSSSSIRVTTQISPAHRPSTTSSSTVTTPALSPLTSTSSLTSSSSETVVFPIATKRCHPIPSKPTPSVLKHPEEMKRPCLRDISGLGSNTDGGNLTGGPNKGQKPAPNNFREESIGDLLDGLEDELFDDF